MNTKDVILQRLDRIEELLQAETAEWLTVKQAALYLDISVSHLYKLTSSRRIVHYKPAGKKVFFRKRDLDAYLARNRVKTADEIDQHATARVVLNS